MRVPAPTSSPDTPAANAAAAAHPLACRNCEASLMPAYAYCPQCGQETHDAPPHFFEFLHEFIHHYVALEGTLWKSLWLLLAHPGKLTLEYLAGRKNRYVWPLRLFLTLSFVFFLTLNIASKFHNVKTDDVHPDATGPAKPAAVHGPEAAKAELAGEMDAPKKDGLDALADAVGQEIENAKTQKAGSAEDDVKIGIQIGNGWLPAFLQARVDRFNAEALKDPAGTVKHVGKAFLGSVPTAILALLPFFAGILALVYWPRRMAYGTHFVFTLHLHAFWYLCLWLLVLAPWAGLGGVILGWMNLYTVIALKRVYGGGWMGTFIRAGLIALLHWILMAVVMAVDILFISLA